MDELITHTYRVREAVGHFADRMEYKLKCNDHKGGWNSCTMEYLLRRLKEEVAELEKMIDDPQLQGGVDLECADVANFAMMIAEQYPVGKYPELLGSG